MELLCEDIYLTHELMPSLIFGCFTLCHILVALLSPLCHWTCLCQSSWRQHESQVGYNIFYLRVVIYRSYFTRISFYLSVNKSDDMCSCPSRPEPRVENPHSQRTAGPPFQFAVAWALECKTFCCGVFCLYQYLVVMLLPVSNGHRWMLCRNVYP